MSPSRRAQGFTLIEMMVAMAVGAIAVASITAAFISQTRQYRSHANRRASQANARQALNAVEESLRAAGYGVDPDRVFLAYDSFDVDNPSAAATNYPDAITIHTRDPVFRRQLTSVTTTAGSEALTWSNTQALTEPLHPGQILLVLCSGARTYRYVTVKDRADVGANSVTLAPSAGAPAESPISMPGARYRQQAQLTDPCFSNVASMPTMVKIDRVSYYVAEFDDDGVAATAGSTPYLMAHRGLDLSVPADGVGVNDATPVAAGVEQLQIAYVMNGLPSASPTVLGVVSTALPPFGTAWITAGTPPPVGPALTDSYDSANRRTNHPANIRQVRVTLVSRGSMRDAKTTEKTGDNFNEPTLASSTGALVGTTVPWKQLENLGATPAKFDPKGGGFTRTIMRTSVTPKNLLMRTQFLPPNTVGGG